ncbi:MAG: M13 family metallopeptidase N-terminal domain-containing protein, partial [Pseudomonadota bacterium]
MIRTFMAALLLSLAPGFALAAETTAPAKPMGSGIDLQYIDASVKPQQDFFRHVSGKWLNSVEIPADRARFGSFDQLRDSAESQLRAIIDELAAKKDLPAGVEARKIADLYNSFMDQATAQTRGLKPLQSELARIDGLQDKREIPALLARLTALGVNLPILAGIDQDARDSSRYAVYLSQGGLGLPDRDYYLKLDDAKLKNARAEYLKHVAKMLGMTGQKNSGRAAQNILDFETGLAKVQWTKVENRDPVKTYNKTEVGKLPELVAGYDWKQYFAAAGIGDKVGYVIVRQPSYFQDLGKLLEKTPLPVWQTYFKWHLLKAYAPYLDQRFVDAEFAFSGKT